MLLKNRNCMYGLVCYQSPDLVDQQISHHGNSHIDKNSCVASFYGYKRFRMSLSQSIMESSRTWKRPKYSRMCSLWMQCWKCQSSHCALPFCFQYLECTCICSTKSKVDLLPLLSAWICQRKKRAKLSKKRAWDQLSIAVYWQINQLSLDAALRRFLSRGFQCDGKSKKSHSVAWTSLRKDC